MLPVRLFYGIFLVVGLVLLGIATYSYRLTSAFVHSAAQAEGNVVAMRASRHRSKSGMSTSYTPVVRFRSAANEEIQFTSNFSTSPPSHHVGEKVSVLYRKDTPHDAQISDFWSLWFATVLLTGMGTVFTVVGCTLMLTNRASMQSSIRSSYR